MESITYFIESSLRELEYGSNQRSLSLQTDLIEEVYQEASRLEEKMAENYAEFCVYCDRNNLPIIRWKDWLKQVNK